MSATVRPPAAPSPVPADSRPDPDEFVLSPSNFLRSARRHPRLLLGIPLAAAAATAATVLLIPPRFSSSATLVPERSSAMGPFGGLASLAGLTVPVGSDAQSPELYAQVLRSRPVLERLVTAAYPEAAAADGRPRSLVDFFAPDGKTPGERAVRAERMLRDRTRVEVDRKTSTLTLTVTTVHPPLSFAVAQRYLGELRAFNRETRSTQARARREFVEARLAEVTDSLRAAENALLEFVSKNRTFGQASALQVQRARLERELTVQQELFLGLRKELDRARIDEVDDTPQFTLLEAPVVPALKSGPQRVRITFGVTLLIVIATAVALVLFDERARLRRA